jgi:serine/threonine-protein kinase RsbW
VSERSRIVVSGPAHAETLGVLRAVAASVAARFDLPYDRVDELRMAVDEAATLVIQAGPATTVTLDIDIADPSAIGVRLRSDGPAGDWPADRSRSWAWRVIDELAPGAAMSTSDDGCPEVSFSWSLDARSSSRGGAGA